MKNCPFTLSQELTKYNETLYGKRRCELYNINKNSRYKYQYICSYNASKGFKNDKTKDGLNTILCVNKTENIEGNNIINIFNQVFNNEENDMNELFYCSRIDEPKKDEYIKDEYCNEENDSYSSVQLLVIVFDFISFLHRSLITALAKNIVNKVQNLVLELRRDINLIVDQDENDTEDDEPNSNDTSFHEEEDQNIILEDHIQYDVNANINDFNSNEKKQKLD